MAGFFYSKRRSFRNSVNRWTEKAGAEGGWTSNRILTLLESLSVYPGIGNECHALAGIMQAAAGRQAPAIAHFEAALAGGLARDAGIHHRLGLAKLKAGQAEAAVPSLRRAFDLAANDTWPCKALADCLLTLGQAVEAEQIYRKALQRNVNDSWLHMELHNAMCLQDRADESLDELIAAAAAVPPGNGPLPVALPWYILFPSIVNESRSLVLSEVVAKHPEAGEAIIFLARMESLLGKYKTATERLHQAGALVWPELFREQTETFEGCKTPEFLIIGQAKAGTTTLYDSLCGHPLIKPPLFKEPHYWSLHNQAGIDWYRAHFPPIPIASEWITGEASTSYFHDPNCPHLIAETLPNIKLILLVRDPVARLYSHYWMNIRRGEERRSFNELVEEELSTFQSCPLEISDYELCWNSNNNSYLLRSTVLAPLKRWLSCFPKERLLILDTSELAKDLPGTLQRVCTFLDLPPLTPDQANRKNAGFYSPMDPALEQRLRDWFAPHQIALEDYLSVLKIES